MISSMTGFASQHIQTELGNISWEVRSVNHRYLDAGFRLPEIFRDLEPLCREKMKSHVARGKLDCSLRFQASANQAVDCQINQALVSSLKQANDQVMQLTDNQTPMKTNDYLRWPGVVEMADAINDHTKQAIIDIFQQAMQQLADSRAREGDAIAKLLNDRLEQIEQLVKAVREQQPAVLQAHRQRLQQKLDDFDINVDENRLEQECVLAAQKLDIAEELDRLATHVNEMRDNLKHGGVLGRRLDFLVQEFNREANTIAAKSIDANVTKLMVDIKVLIEQMREQIQNIE